MNTPVMGRWGCTHQSWGGGGEHTSHGEVGVNTPVMGRWGCTHQSWGGGGEHTSYEQKGCSCALAIL